jgi:hypothetical protein
MGRQLNDFCFPPLFLRCISTLKLFILKAKGTGKDFLNRTSAAQQLRERMEKMGLHEIKKLLHNKRNGL